jgi:GNAT superfamily N-acetyltransferase
MIVVMNGTPVLSQLTVRPIEADDAGRMPRLFSRLSADTIYRRFFAPLPSLSAHTLRQLMDVDHHDREALVALDGDEIVAVARWARAVHDGAEAEVAVVVEDAWQHLGLGRALTRALVERARRARITTLTATIQADNGRAKRLATAFGAPSRVGQAGGQISLAFELAD